MFSAASKDPTSGGVAAAGIVHGDLWHNAFMINLYFRSVKSLTHLPFVVFMVLNLVFGHDWVHVPELVEHYQQHKQRDASMGFVAFLAMHYGEAEHADTDGSHEQLPFQHHHHGTGIDAGVSKAPDQDPVRTVSFRERSAEQDFPLPDADALLSGHSAELLRPPKAMA